MEIKNEFKTNSYNILHKTKQYFLNSKFILQSENEHEIVFSRGNVFLNWITFNPLRWKSTTKIIVKNSKVQLHSKISTTGQIVAKHEVDLWNKFFANYKKSIVQEVSLNTENKITLSETKYISFKLILKGTVIGFFIGFVSVFIVRVIKDFVIPLL